MADSYGPEILNLKTSREVIFDFLIGNDIAAFEYNFIAKPDKCECGHQFKFEDRLAAAVLMAAHNKEEILDVLKQGPKIKEYFQGALYCGDCHKFVFAKLNYEYPNHKQIPHDDFEMEFISKFQGAIGSVPPKKAG